MIQPQTILSLAVTPDDKVPEGNSAPSSQASSAHDAVVPSTSGSQSKKLTCKMNQSDRVLAYLKASVSTRHREVPLTLLILVGCLILISDAQHVTLQDKAAQEAQKENNMYKRQLIGLLAKVHTTSLPCDCDCASHVKKLAVH